MHTPWEVGMMNLSDFKVSQRVQAHPSTDTWVRGDRYGTVEKIGRKYVHVRMDKSGRLVQFIPDNLTVNQESGQRRIH